MILTLEGLKEQSKWETAGISLPSYDVEKIAESTKKAPVWVHFGVGNIFRIFIGGLADQLLNAGETDKGIICVETFDFDVIDKIYVPHDNLVLGVTLKADGSTRKRVIGSLTEAVKAQSSDPVQWGRLKEVFADPGLQMVSFTITEKGYALKNVSGDYFPFVQADIDNGPEKAGSAMAVVCALLYHRYQNGGMPLAMVSMDNCSHNGEKLQSSVLAMAEAWREKGFVDAGFVEYISDEKRISFPWTMIDKITPRPADSVCSELQKDGVEDIAPVITSKNTYIAPFVNAEGPQYLVIEDKFPNGRPKLEAAGVYMTDRATVNKVERMKVTTCLNPLHTALAVYGCILGYTLIADEMKDPQLNRLVREIGPVEGMPVVTNPGILSPKDFVDEVINVRIPNPFMPDTPQRIATDTSQKVGIRYGETIKAYVAEYGDAGNLTAIPLALAGWCRYLLAVDDRGESFELSPDPMLPELSGKLSGIVVGRPDTYKGQLKEILSNANIFGIDLYEAGIGGKVESLFVEMIQGPGAVRKVLEKYMKAGNKMSGIAEKIHEYGVVPVVVLTDAKDAGALADVLCEEGLPCAEITFRTEAAAEAIRVMTQAHPEMLVGAGTVLTTEQVDQAVEAGAEFIVSPGFDPEIVDYCIEKEIAVFPGCVTPSEAAQAVKRGLKVVKFFPAGQFGGIDTVKALAAPYTKLQFMPTGGVNKENLEKYLRFDKVIACGGSWMVKKELIESGAFDQIRQMTKETVEIVRAIRSR